MNELFGLSMTLLMLILLAALGACLATFAGVYLANRTMFRMGLRNIRRRRAQSILIVFGLMLATVIITAAFTVGDVLDYSVTKVAYDNLQRTDLSLHTFRPETAQPGQSLREEYYAPQASIDGIERAFAGDPDIEGFMPFLFEGLPVLNPRTKQAEPTVIAAGFDTARLERFGSLRTTAGERLDLDTLGPDDVLLGKRAADALDSRVADTLVVFANGEEHQVRVAAIVRDERAAGTLEFGGGEQPAMAAPLATIQRITGHAGKINGMSVVLFGGVRGSLGHSDAVSARLKAFAADDAAKSAAGLDGLVFYVEENKQDSVQAAELLGNLFTTMFIVLGLFSIAAGTMLIFTLFVMLAAERRQEMGIARAVGAERRHLVQAFIAEGMVYDLAAGLVGTGLGVAAAFGIVVGGTRLLMGDELSFVTPHVTPRSLVVSFCLGATLTFATVVISSLRISRLNIVEAIRGQSATAGRPAKRRTSWPWVIAGVPALLILPLGLYWLLRKGLGMPWAWIAGPGGIVLGLNLVALGKYLDLAFPFMLGMSLVPLAIGALAVYYRASARVVWSLVGLFLLLYWLMPFELQDRIFGKMDSNMEMFVLSGIFIVAGFTMVIVYNARLLTKVFATRGRGRRQHASALVLAGGGLLCIAAAVASGGRWGGLGEIFYMVAVFAFAFALLAEVAVRHPRFAPALRMGIAYPLANRFRTGMTIAMFSIVIFAITTMGIINGSFLRMFATSEGRGGWDLYVTTNLNNPIDDLRAALEQEGSVDPAKVQAIGRTTEFDNESQQARIPGGEWYQWPVLAADAEFWAEGRMTLDGLARGFETDQQVFDAIAHNPGLALIDSSVVQSAMFNGSYGTLHVDTQIDAGKHFEPFQIEVGDTVSGHSRTVTVVGILSSRILILYGAFINEEAYRGIFGSPDYTQQYVRLRPGEDSARDAKAIEAALVTQGVQAQSIEVMVNDAMGQSRAFLRIFQVFMGLGLFVGIAALGVIALRSVVERRQQIGMLRAIGYQKSTVALSFLLESTFIAAAGVLSGVAGAAILSWNLVTSDYFVETGGPDFAVPWAEIAAYSIVAMGFALLMSWWPSRRAASVPVAEALRYE